MNIDADGIEQNVYDVAKNKYPLAWEILYKLANMEKQSMRIDQKPMEKQELGLDASMNDNVNMVVCNGFTLEFDGALKEIIGEIIADKVYCFYSDCFKMVSRNFEKILHVLQILMENDKIFCTCNYYISTKQIEKRDIILRAAHDYKGVLKNMHCDGAPNKIRECINMMTSCN